MKNFSKLFAIALAAVSLSASAATVLLTTDAADPNGVDGAAGPNDSLDIVAVAKIKGVLEVRLTNAGLAADQNEQRFAFGQSATNSDAESFEIDPNAASLASHICAGAGTGHIQRLIEDAVNPGACAMDGSPNKKINASFKIAYKIDAAGGVTGELALYVDNGMDETLAAANVSNAFLSASMAGAILTGSLVDAGAAVSQSEIIPLDSSNDEDQGVLTYAVEFDVAGASSKPESRVRFDHILTVL